MKNKEVIKEIKRMVQDVKPTKETKDRIWANIKKEMENEKNNGNHASTGSNS